jgi:hypothetical protein
LTSLQPRSALAALQWQRTVTFLHDVLDNSEAAAQPLITGNAARLLAATVLTTFPNTAILDPTGRDRQDATSTTLRRAIAFIEQRLGDEFLPEARHVLATARHALEVGRLAAQGHAGEVRFGYAEDPGLPAHPARRPAARPPRAVRPGAAPADDHPGAVGGPHRPAPRPRLRLDARAHR